MELFEDFDTLAAAATRHHYEHDLQLPLNELTLVDTTQIVDEVRTREERQQAMSEFFEGRWSVLRPLRLPVDEIRPLDVAATAAALHQARVGMARWKPSLANQYRHIEALGMRRHKAFAAEELLTAGLTMINAAEFELAEPTLACATSTREWATEQIRAHIADLDQFDESAARRLTCGLSLAAKSSAGGEPWTLVSTFDALVRALPDALSMLPFCIAVTVVEKYQAIHGEGFGRDRLAVLNRRISEGCEKLAGGLAGVAPPNWLATEAKDLAEWCGMSGASKGLEPLDSLNRLGALYEDLLGRLAVMALSGEASLAPQEL
jgi:hypothetical protein